MLFKLIRFFFNFIEPEVAHKLAIKFIKSPILKLKNVQDNSYDNLNQRIFGLNFKNPIGLAAGFDKNAEIYNEVSQLGFAYSEIGTVTPKPQEGNLKPRVFRLAEDEAIINRLGFPNYGMDIIKERICSDIPNNICGINIGPNKENAVLTDDYILCFDKFFDVASYIAINISSPNTPNLRLQHNNKKISNLIDVILERRAEKKSKVPILFKLSPDISDLQIRDLCQIFLKKNIDGVILTNTSVQDRSYLNNKKKLENGGLSGKPLNDLSNQIIRKFYAYLKKDIPIIGVGGVSNGETAFEKIKSGASLLQLYTSIVYEGPYVANKINQELSDLIKKNGYKNVSDIIGINSK